MPSPPSRGLAGCSDSSGMRRRKIRVEVEEGVGKHKESPDAATGTDRPGGLC